MVTQGGWETGSTSASNCQTVNAQGQYSNYAGCTVNSGVANSYGNNFNAAGGGIYAMQWTDTYIKMWVFPRASIAGIPTLTSANPDPDQFGEPDANFQGCAIR